MDLLFGQDKIEKTEWVSSYFYSRVSEYCPESGRLILQVPNRRSYSLSILDHRIDQSGFFWLGAESVWSQKSIVFSIEDSQEESRAGPTNLYVDINIDSNKVKR